MSDPDQISAAKRRRIASRRVGIGAQCACGENRPRALIVRTSPIICAECKRRTKKRAIYDQHHVAGKSNHCLTIPIPVNEHQAELNVAQDLWPKDTLKNPNKSPLLAIAACIRVFVDTMRLLLDKLLAWIPEYLEMVDAFLTFYLGPKWWSSKKFIEFKNKRSKRAVA